MRIEVKVIRFRHVNWGCGPGSKWVSGVLGVLK